MQRTVQLSCNHHEKNEYDLQLAVEISLEFLLYSDNRRPHHVLTWNFRTGSFKHTLLNVF